ncbi:MAG: DNA-3-methyladenine glycosylase 2 family protein [Ignavibacteriales bacterium]|nr:DNA-3-methyladenine glycosylase 2 family protein [Ignavibacteriales bacterium]
MNEINEYNCAVKHFLAKDVSIYNLMKKHKPIYLKKRRNYFVQLCNSIVGQQLSVKSASAIRGRFLNYYNNLPTPELVNETDFAVLRSLGLSNAKAKYVKDLAKQIIDKKISLKNIGAKSDEEIIDTLTKVKGIGPWTTHMFLMFVLGRKNILPTGDLGIKKAIMLNYNLKNLPTGEDISELSKKNNWNPYNTYACMYLWKSIDGE